MDINDFKKDPSYRATGLPSTMTLPKFRYIMIDGHGAPESDQANEGAFQQTMKSLFGAIYTIKFWDKKHPAPPGYSKFTLAPIEALWWVEGQENFDLSRPDKWCWTIMMRVPDFVTPKYFQSVIQECVRTKQTEHYRNLRLDELAEGLCAQIMHVGPYAAELPTIRTLHDYIRAQGYKPVGKHHEIYFGDPRRTAPEKLRTIIRQPMN